MNAMDSPRYEAAYADLCACYGKKLMPETLAKRDAWWRKLSAYSIDQVEAAFEAAPRYSKSFFPNIGNVIEALDEMQADKGGAIPQSPTRFYQRTNEHGEQVTEAEYACPVCCDTRWRARVVATGEIVPEIELQRRRVLSRDDPQYLSASDYRMWPCACRAQSRAGAA